MTPRFLGIIPCYIVADPRHSCRVIKHTAHTRRRFLVGFSTELISTVLLQDFQVPEPASPPVQYKVYRIIKIKTIKNPPEIGGTVKFSVIRLKIISEFQHTCVRRIILVQIQVIVDRDFPPVIQRGQSDTEFATEPRQTFTRHYV